MEPVKELLRLDPKDIIALKRLRYAMRKMEFGLSFNQQEYYTNALRRVEEYLNANTPAGGEQGNL